MKNLLMLFHAAIIGTALIGCAVTQPNAVHGTPMEEMIQSAKTRADHEAIAKHYDDEAKASQAKAEKHRKMSAAYRIMGTGKGTGTAGFVAHCDKLVTKYEELAKDNLELAKLHRQVAEESGQ